MLRCVRPIRFNVLKRTPQLIELRAPSLWIFLSSLQPESFRSVLGAFTGSTQTALSIAPKARVRLEPHAGSLPRA